MQHRAVRPRIAGAYYSSLSRLTGAPPIRGRDRSWRPVEVDRHGECMRRQALDVRIGTHTLGSTHRGLAYAEPVHDASAQSADDPRLHRPLGLQRIEQRRMVPADQGAFDERAFADELRAPLERLAGDVQGPGGALSARAKETYLAGSRAVHGLVAQGLDEQWSQFVDRRVVIQGPSRRHMLLRCRALSHGEGQLHLLASSAVCSAFTGYASLPGAGRSGPARRHGLMQS